MPAWLDSLVVEAAASMPEEVLEELWARGMSSEQADQFQVGYLHSLPDGDYPQEFIDWYHDRDDALLFPLTTFQGTIGGVQARYRDRARKGYSDYLFSKGEPCLFGLREAAPHVFKSRSAVVVEGCFDFFPTQRTIPYTIATLTAKVDSGLLRTLSRVVDRIGCFYDQDKGGKRGFWGLKTDAPPSVEVYRMEYPIEFPHKDPGELWEMYGEDWFARYLGEIK